MPEMRKFELTLFSLNTGTYKKVFEGPTFDNIIDRVNVELSGGGLWFKSEMSGYVSWVPVPNTSSIEIRLMGEDE